MRQFYKLFAALFLLLSVVGGKNISVGYAQALKTPFLLAATPQAQSIRTLTVRQNAAPLDGKVGVFVGYRPSRLQKGNISFRYPYAVYSAKLGGPLFSDSLVYERNIQEDVSWGIGLGGTLEGGKTESFWFHLRGEGQIARHFGGANLDFGGGYEFALFDKILVQPVLLYSLGWTWLQLGKLYRGTGSGNQEWYIPVRDRNFYSDVRVNLRTFYMALRPMITASYLIGSNLMLRASAGYILPFFHSLAIRFVGEVEDDSLQSTTGDPRNTGSGFIYNGRPTDRSIQSFGGLMFNLEFLYTFKDE
jgi:hypothetical protein